MDFSIAASDAKNSVPQNRFNCGLKNEIKGALKNRPHPAANIKLLPKPQPHIWAGIIHILAQQCLRLKGLNANVGL